MLTVELNNSIENIYRDVIKGSNNGANSEFNELYKSFSDESLIMALSTLHCEITESFDMMNQRLPTGDYNKHFWADSSRRLLNAIKFAEKLQRLLKSTEYELKINDYYQSLINKCKNFLKISGGSEIPKHMNEVELYYKLPIFIKKDVIENRTLNANFDLKLIGEGSYALVYKYEDTFYNKDFILKRAKTDLNEKEKLRFKQEFDEMKKLVSPYIVEVYSYNEEKLEYTMECMNNSLLDYIKNKNSSLDKKQRTKIGLQILKAFSYIHSKDLLHRDISPKNVLLKEYDDDVVVVKISDFGLVKSPNSDLTSLNTEMKGCFNDPNLSIIGFSKYNMVHEIFALTRLLAYIMTGKERIEKIKDEKIKNFISIGMHQNESKRFKNINELCSAFYDL